MIRVAAYCRVSTDGEDQSNSYQAQQRYFRESIARNPEWQLYEIYADEGISGTSTRKRLRFRKMMEDAQAGKFQLILTKEVSRFSRNLLDTIAYTRKLKKLGVGVCFLTDGINTLEGDGELRLSIMASIAQEESRKTSARVKWGQQRQMERGVVFGHSLLGYTLRRGVLYPEAEGAAVVQRIFHSYGRLQHSASRIARELNADGCMTATGGTWQAGTVLKVLKNEKYVGDLVQKKSYTPDFLSHEKKTNRGQEALIVLKDHHEALVSRELWDCVQRRMEQCRRTKAASGSGSTYPLSGKLFCGLCGAALVARRKKTGDGGTVLRWGCSRAAARGRAGCDVGCMLPDEGVREMLRLALDTLPGLEEEALQDIYRLLDAAAQKQKAQLLAQLQRLRRRRQELLEQAVSSLLQPEDLRVLLEQCERRQEALEEALEKWGEGRAFPPRPPEALLREALCRLPERISLFRDGRTELQLPGLSRPFVFLRTGEKKEGNID